MPGIRARLELAFVALFSSSIMGRDRASIALENWLWSDRLKELKDRFYATVEDNPTQAREDLEELERTIGSGDPGLCQMRWFLEAETAVVVHSRTPCPGCEGDIYEDTKGAAPYHPHGCDAWHSMRCTIAEGPEGFTLGAALSCMRSHLAH